MSEVEVIEIPGGVYDYLSHNGDEDVPKPGDIYEFVYDMGTRARTPDGKPIVHRKGSIIQVMAETKETPYNEISEMGRNLICRDQFITSIWSTFDSNVIDGKLKRVYRRPPELAVSGPVANQILLNQEWAVYSVISQ